MPGDIAIAGFDDVDLAQQLDPALTTVRVPMRQIGEHAGMLLLERLDGATPAARIVDLGFEIVERASTGA